ncbi:hypothetical protein AAFF_G00163550, partial [Aldrovandia affinis]
MDKSKNKRKLRSGKEVGKDKEADKFKGSDSKDAEGSADGTPPTAKRVKADDITRAEKGKAGTSAEEEAEPEKALCQEEDTVIERQAGGGTGQAANLGRTCSLCSFVAKTPTALKIHAKRKHFREGASSRKHEPATNAQQEGGRENFATADITDNFETSSLKGGQLQIQNTEAEGQFENIPSPKCQEAAESDCVNSGKDVTGKDTEAEGKNACLKMRAKLGDRGVSQSGAESSNLSPTQILLEMVETVTKAQSMCLEESSEHDNSHHSGGEENQGPSDGLMAVGTSSEAAGQHAAIAQGGDNLGDDCQMFGAQVDPKEAEAVEEQGTSVGQKAAKRGPKPKAQHPCGYCGHVLCDKPSLAMHLKRHHTKEMNFSCEPCSYACMAKSDFEKHCLSNKHKTRALVGADAAGGVHKPEDTLQMAAQVPSEGSDSANAAQLQAQSDHSHHDAGDDVAATTNGKPASRTESQTAKEQILGEGVEEAHASQGRKSPGEDPVLDDDTQRKEDKDDDTEEQQSTGVDQTMVSDVTGSAEELTEGRVLKKRRGRPKGSTTTTCQFCGLVASNATNLNVHIRRRHSHKYGFICKVCSYSCVTKGDMDRHCATKKHIKRVEVDNLSQLQDCPVSPNSVVEVIQSKVVVTGDQQEEEEDGKEEAGATLPTGEKTTPNDQKNVQAQTEDGQTGSADQQDVTAGEPTSPAQKKCKYDSVNTCTYCGFVAHSLPSLELHIKRKHTRDFEFVCLACNYYAVTCREMSRHASTDKHKQKSQSYLEFLGNNEVDVTQLDVSGEAVSESNPGGRDVNSSGSPVAQEPASDKDQQTDVEARPGPSSPNGDVVPSCSGEEAINQSEQDGPEAIAEEQAVTGGDGVEEDGVQEDGVEEAAESQESIPGEKDPGDTEPQGQGGALCAGSEQATPTPGSPSTEVSEGSIADPPVESTCTLGGKAESEVEDECGHEGSSEADPELADESVDSPSTSKLLLRALPFDASIVPFRVAFEGNIPMPPGKKVPPQRRAAQAVTTGRRPPKKTKAHAAASSSAAAKGGRGARIRCDDCGFMADGLSGLNVHMSMKHPSKDKHFHCLLCGKSFYTESNLHQHLTSAAHLRSEQASIKELPEGGASFKCVKCSDPFATEQELFTHIKEKHEELLREVNKYVLEDTEQINREREENQGCVCKHCGKVCKSSNSMAFLAHVRTHTGSKPFKCKLCDFATAQLGDARNHVKRHLGVREYKCPVCGWAFVMKKHLNTHMLGKHGVGQPKERKFECELCDRTFSEKWSLNNHMKLHTGAKPYKCTWPACHYSFLTMSAMKDHYRTHTGEKSFLCDLCGFAGGTRHALTKHRRQHTGEKPFKCHLCNFASTTQSHLTRHRRVHTGEKPYHCPWCHYRSNCAENIRKHILHTGKHEGVKMYNCPKCEYGTNGPMDFRNHLKELHPDIENPDLAYLHAGIVSKSFECRLKGQGATFVKAEATFPEEGSPDQGPRDGPEEPAVQQFIIIQGYGEDYAIDSALEESAAATLQTLAMGGQVAEVLHITEDGQVIGAGPGDAHQLPAGATQFVLVESEEVGPVLGRPEAPGGHGSE